MTTTKSAILIPFVVLIMLLVCCGSVVVYWQQQNGNRQEIADVGEDIQGVLAIMQQADAAMMHATIRSIQHIDSVKQAYLRQDRTGLYALSNDLFQTWKGHSQLTHFYFHQPDGINFLRVHQPDRHGDLIDRHTLRLAQETGQPTSGLELGPLGTLTLRTVSPWYDGETLIGFIELGEEIGHIISAIAAIHNIAIHVFINKNHLNPTGWQAGIKMLGIQTEWDTFADHVLVHQPEAASWPLLHTLEPNLIGTNQQLLPDRTADQEHFNIAILPIDNVVHQQVAWAVIIKNVTAKIHQSRRLFALVLVVGLLSGGGLIVLLWRLLNRFEMKSLRQSHRWYELHRRHQLILNTVQESICGMDQDGHITFINAAGAALTGWNSEELIGQLQHAVFHHSHADGSPYPWERCPNYTTLQDGHQYQVENEVFWRKDGTSFPVEYTSIPLLDQGEISGAVLVFRDISHKQALQKKELNSQSSRIAISALLETSAEPLSMVDQLQVALEIILTVPWLSLQYRGAIFLMDEAGEQLILTAQLGLHPSLLTLCDRVAMGQCLCGRAAQQREIIFASCIDDDHETRFPDMPPHGHYCVPIFFGERLIGIFTLYVPDGHHYNPDEEAFLTTISYTLANLIEQQRRKQETADANRFKSDFLANMSHEIRTPMNAIMGLADLALQHQPPLKIADYLTKIADSSRFLLHIINDVLDFSKIEANKLELEQTDFLLQDIFDHLTDLFRVQVANKQLELIFCASQECYYQLRGDPLRLEQILMNLVSNAIKFTDQGTIEVKVVTLQQSDDRVTLQFSVHDTGIGMTDQQATRLFQPFTQVDSSTTRRFGGTGLGLSISKRLVEMMDGRIWVNTVPEQGSTFYFTIPYQRILEPEKVRTIASTQRAVVDVTDIRQRIGTARILLVEDNAINQQVACELLENIGLTVTIAANGLEACTKVAETHFDAVLMDIQMPQMDGYTATNRIRSDPRHHNLPIIAMTAHAMSGDRNRCLQAGMNDHVSKPINKQQLYATLLEWIQPRTGLGLGPVVQAVLPDNDGSICPALAGIDHIAALERFNGNQRLFRSVLSEFHRDYAQAAATLRSNLTSQHPKDLQSAAQLLHTVKGLAGNLSAHRLFQAASSLEQQFGQPITHLLPQLDEFEAALLEVIDAIAAMKQSPRATDGPVGTIPLDHVAIQTLLLQLGQAINNEEFESQRCFDRLAPLLTYGSDEVNMMPLRGKFLDVPLSTR
ncbi:MAG: response regulator, partial [Magnetococcales bacterium]|nr:response regulator [Magnetococcales bacterium]